MKIIFCFRTTTLVHENHWCNIDCGYSTSSASSVKDALRSEVHLKRQQKKFNSGVTSEYKSFMTGNLSTISMKIIIQTLNI